MTADNLASALASVQAALPTVHKNRTANTGSYSYKYADLNDVASAIHPLLGAAGLAFIARPTLDEEGRFVLAYELRHVGGESVTGNYPLPDPAKVQPQQIGSALTYARRYTLCSVTGVVPDEDDDGQAAQSTTAKRPERKAERQSKTGPPADDPWQAPEGVTPSTPAPKESDAVWFEQWQAKVSDCTDLTALVALYDEAKEARRHGKLNKADFEDAVVLKDVQKAAIERASGDWPDVAKVPA